VENSKILLRIELGCNIFEHGNLGVSGTFQTSDGWMDGRTDDTKICFLSVGRPVDDGFWSFGSYDTQLCVITYMRLLVSARNRHI